MVENDAFREAPVARCTPPPHLPPPPLPPPLGETPTLGTDQGRGRAPDEAQLTVKLLSFSSSFVSSLLQLKLTIL